MQQETLKLHIHLCSAPSKFIPARLQQLLKRHYRKNSNIYMCCDEKEGGRVPIPSCEIRYGVYPFYEPSTRSATPPPHTTLILSPSPPPDNIKQHPDYQMYPPHITLSLWS
ncbi:hypothetical protein FEM48_Zijuj07G0055900 [Ziziphus jujuba var. spinosa]|uniref:Uncharacterized protein n=1 Tax=Ziziphus jujuba var. spinosa TaxID=714518 RepID=A0A978V2S0_ZIZJJ|nr:hypothetical protein FEM48_Zijuj07G0055900 [Ziziphus jujuba var. spinosa]